MDDKLEKMERRWALAMMCYALSATGIIGAVICVGTSLSGGWLETVFIGIAAVFGTSMIGLLLYELGRIVFERRTTP